MKTFIDKSNPNSVRRYLELFEMANAVFALPENQDKAPKDENGQILQINDIEQYFTCIGTLKSIDPKFAYLLPLDESFFEIDANTRAIKVPSEFSKGVGVQSDVISETLLFKINRFVDAKDLNDVENIWIQWQYGPLNNPTSEGVFKVDFRYINYDPNYLIFAWPLMGRVTKNHGTLRFSVRFESTGSDGISYSLNTLPATVTLNPALKADMDYDEPYESASALFDQAIQDSQQTSTPSENAAVRPNFNPAIAPGADMLPDKAYLYNNALTLRAQAITTDTGNLSYVWYSSDNAAQDAVILTTKYIKTEDINRDGNYKRYYYSEGSGDAQAYKIYTGTITNGQTADGKDLYEYVAELNIPVGEGTIAGLYRLDATNRLGWSANSTSSAIITNGNADGFTQIVEIPGPEKLIFKDGGDLDPDKKYITTSEDDVEQVSLSVNVEYDDFSKLVNVDLPIIDYHWEKTLLPREGNVIEADGKVTDKRTWLPVPSLLDLDTTGEGIDKFDYIVTMNQSDLAKHLEDKGYDVSALSDEEKDLPGWYRVIVTSQVNRDTNSITSTECKVTRDPVAPELDHKENDTAKTQDIEINETANFTLEIKNFLTAIEENKLLETEKITYQWFDNSDVALEGSGFVGELSKDNIQVDENGNKKLVINVAFTLTEKPAAYYCVVTNELNGKTAASRSGYFTIL